MAVPPYHGRHPDLQTVPHLHQARPVRGPGGARAAGACRRRRTDVSDSARDRPPAPDPLPIAVVDNPTHLDLSRDDNDAPDIRAAIEPATAARVPRMVQIGCDL